MGSKLAVVKCSSHRKIVIPGNTTTEIMGRIDKRVSSAAGMGIAEHLDGSSLPDGVNVTPTLMDVGANSCPVRVQLSNMTARPVVITSNCIMCQVQSCTLAPDTDVDTAENAVRTNSLLDKIDLSEAIITEDEKSKLLEFLSEWKDVFAIGDLDVGLTSAVKHQIILNNTTPFKQRHRRIPPGNSYFSVLDMKSGYHQVEIQEEHKPYTAFTAGALGFYEYNRLPFGLSNSPATYQRLMEECLEELISSDVKFCQIYLDDVIIASQSAEEHFDHLERVFSKFRLAGLKLSPKKCHLFRDRVKYVGHVVSVNGVETDPDKIKKVAGWPVPTNTAELRTFLGFSGYYRRFVKNFAQITKPLTHILTGDPKYQKKKKFKLTKKTGAVEWIWGDAEQDAFDAIKGCLISSPIMAYPVYNQPLALYFTRK